VVRILTIDSTEAPVSIAVELATFMTNAFQYLLGFFRWEFVSMRDFFFMTILL